MVISYLHIGIERRHVDMLRSNMQSEDFFGVTLPSSKLTYRISPQHLFGDGERKLGEVDLVVLSSAPRVLGKPMG